MSRPVIEFEGGYAHTCSRIPRMGGGAHDGPCNGWPQRDCAGFNGPGDPGKFPTEPQVREPRLPWEPGPYSPPPERPGGTGSEGSTGVLDAILIWAALLNGGVLIGYLLAWVL